MHQLLNNLLGRKKLLAFLLGLVSVEALPPFYIFPILFFTLSALLLLINSASSKKSAFAIGYWFGFGYFAGNMSWIGNALLIDAANLGWLYPICFFSAGAFFGLFVALPALLSYCFKNFYSRYLVFSGTWVIFEWIRSFIFTGFPWNLLGSVLAFSNQAIQLASVIGTYGLSFLVLMLTTAPALLIFYRNRKSTIITTTILILLPTLIFGFGAYRLNHNHSQDSATTIRIVQPAIPQAIKWNKEELNNNFKQYIKLSQSEGLEKVNFVIWGETATPYPLDYEPQALQEIIKAIPNHGYLITGLVRYQLQEGDFAPLNSMFVIDKQGRIRNHYDKSHLVPFGEYIPFRSYLPNWIRPVTNTIADFIPGSGPKVITVDKQPGFGTLICYEVIFPSQIIDKNNRPQWLVNLTNDGWYGRSQGPYQHLVTTRLRAVEEGLPIIRAANTGISAAISPYGNIIASISLNEKAFVDIVLPKPLVRPTAYSSYGNILPLILCFLNVILGFIIIRRST